MVCGSCPEKGSALKQHHTTWVRVLGSEESQFLKCQSFAHGVTESCTTWIGTYFILYNFFSLSLFKMDVISLV